LVWDQDVAGSNPVAPTNANTGKNEWGCCSSVGQPVVASFGTGGAGGEVQFPVRFALAEENIMKEDPESLSNRMNDRSKPKPHYPNKSE
jgi:hypothetical protein